MSEIEPLLDHPLIEFVGEIGDAQKSAFLGNAAALLFPIDWPEPFGLVMIEAMACGTPVIAWRMRLGSGGDRRRAHRVPRDQRGRGGGSRGRLDLIDRRAVRATFERRFSAAGDGPELPPALLAAVSGCEGRGTGRRRWIW